jgi:transposase
MFQTDQTNQRQLFAFTPRDLLPENCDVFLYNDLFDNLNLEEFYYSYSPQGQDSVDPKLMLRTIFYGLTHGICSGRKLETAVKFDARYMVLCGDFRPSYRTFHRFLRRHELQVENLFVEVVRLAQAMKLVGLGNLAIDGTRMKGYTSRHQTLKYEKLSSAIEAIKKELIAFRTKLADENRRDEDGSNATSIPSEIRRREKRLQNIERAKRRLEEEAKERGEKPRAKTQISVNDPDARSMGSRKDAYFLGYNAQAAVDGSHQIIVAAGVEDSTNDLNALKSILNQSVENCGSVSKNILADGGYFMTENLVTIEDLGSNPCISIQKLVERERLEHLLPCEDGKAYRCLAGYELKCHPNFDSRETKSGMIITIDEKNCHNCLLTNVCRLFVSRGKKIRAPFQAKRAVIVRHLERSRTAPFKELYKRRKAIVEPVFANVKTQKNLRIFIVGKKKVKIWWKMICTAHNIEKITGYMSRSLQTA